MNSRSRIFKKSLKICPVIALAALMILGMAGCSNPAAGFLDGFEEGDGLSLGGTITISPNVDAIVGGELTAVYSGSETITSYQWKRNGSNVGVNSNRYTPETAGTYTVTVSADGYKNKTSASVDVTVSPPGNGSEADPYRLGANMWANGEILDKDQEVWYSFQVTAGKTYYVWWNDKDQGDGTKTGDVVVAAKYKSSGSVIFGSLTSDYSYNSGWNTPRPFTAASNDTIIIRVIPYGRSATNIGSYSIAYSTDNFRPGLAVPLSANRWTDGEITSGSGMDWYSFNVKAGETYKVWWNERGYYGDGTKTGDVVVVAFNSDRTIIFGDTFFDNINSAWDTPASFTAASTGTVYLSVRPYNNSSYGTGTYAITYSTGTARPSLEPFIIPPGTVQLSAGIWADGEITNENGSDWYSFSITAGTKYYVWWNDSKQGDGYKNGDVTVAAWFENGTTLFGYNNTIIDSGWNTPASFTAASNGKAYIRVIAYNRDSASIGTYGIVFSTDTLRPWPVYTTLIMDTWNDGEVTASSQEWYSFPVVAGKKYRVWWNEKDYCDGTKTGNVKVTAWYENGTNIFNSTANGWKNPQTFTPASNTKVYLNVTPQYYGTYAITYSDRPFRPDNIIGAIANPLTIDQWEDGEFPDSKTVEIWHSFPVTAGETYRVWWNDTYGTLNEIPFFDVGVSAWQDDGTLIFGGTDNTELRGYYTPRIFTAASTCTVYVRVLRQGTWGTGYGVYAIVYSKDVLRPGVNPVPINTNVWVNGNIANTKDENWYSLSVTAGTKYYVWKNEYGGSSGDGTKTATIGIVIRDNNGTVIFSRTGGDSFWWTPGEITAPYDGVLYITVSYANVGGKTGTYGVAFSTGATRPPN